MELSADIILPRRAFDLRIELRLGELWPRWREALEGLEAEDTPAGD